MAGTVAQATARPLAIPRVEHPADEMRPPGPNPIIELSGIGRRCETAHGWVEAVKNIDLEVNTGEFCVIVGPSGCGKTTLLRMLAGLEQPTSGTMALHGTGGERPV